MSIDISGTVPVSSDGAREGIVRRVLRDPMGLVAIVVLGVIVAVAILSPWLRPFDPNAADLSLANSAPGGDYLLGGDRSGRDILSRLISATAASLTSAALATSIAVVVGSIAGLVAGYYGSRVDATLGWFSNLIQAIPGIVALIALYSVVGSTTWLSMSLFGFLMAPAFFRLVRNQVQAVRAELYVDAARVAGLSDLRIISRHILVVVRGPIIVLASFIAGISISIQAGLEFLGLGDPGKASWGGMLEEAFANIYNAPTQMVWPGLALGLTVSAFVLLGNSVRDALEGPRERRKSPRLPGGARPATSPTPSSATSTASTLSIRGLRIAYPSGDGFNEVVKGVDLDIRPGEILGLVGESGSGKSQIAFSALGLLPRTACVVDGVVRVNGLDMVRSVSSTPATTRVSPEIRLGSTIGYVPQDPMSNLDPTFRVGQQLVYGLRASTPMSRAEAKERVLAMLARVGVRDPKAVFSAYPHEISGGTAQRALIAGAVASEPALLVADEPTTALDVTVQAEVLDLLRDLQQDYGMAVLIVTHNLGVVADLCDRVAVMRQGEIVETGDCEQVLLRPSHPYTRTLLASALDEEWVRPEFTKENAR